MVRGVWRVNFAPLVVHRNGHRQAIEVHIHAARRHKIEVGVWKVELRDGDVGEVERDVSEPALADIRCIAGIFDLPVSFFFSDSPDTAEAAYIVRADSRRLMTDDSKGLVEGLLSPDLGGAFEIVHSVFAAGATCPQPFVRPTEEAGYVIDGSLTLIIDDERFVLNKGDSFRFAGESVSWVNEGTVPAVLIWVIAPPVY